MGGIFFALVVDGWIADGDVLRSALAAGVLATALYVAHRPRGGAAAALAGERPDSCRTLNLNLTFAATRL